jgi:sugar phosphate isomerase/epimerase
MDYSRRAFGKLALTGLPAAAILHETSLFSRVLAQAKPNSVINGVILGTITYSYRSMSDQSAEAILRYAVDSGISQLELMGAPVNSYLGAPVAGGGGRGRAGGGGGGAAAGAEGGGGRGRGEPDPATLTAEWNGVKCAPAGAEGARAGGGRGGRGAVAEAPSAEEQAAAAQLAEQRRKWRESSATLDKARALRKMYNDAGVQMYAVKNLQMNASDEELDFQFIVAKALGADHITAELPSGANAAEVLKRVGDRALKHGMYAAYHTHLQGNMTAFDTAFAASKGNKANIDFGHYIAAGSGNPVRFLEKFHDRIASFHLKDRTTPEHCALNLPWGTGETPIKEILQTVKKSGWRIPATIELEYAIPPGSDAVKEVRKCLDYCRAALA